MNMKHKLFIITVTIALIMAMSPGAMASTDELASVQSTAPTDVSAKATKKATIVVKWGKVPQAQAYIVYRATKVDGQYKAVKNTKKTKFTDKKIHPKKRYYYKVTAKMPYENITVSSHESEIVNAKLKIKKSFKVKAYAYSGGGSTKTGKKAKVGRIAVDPKVIKLGTWLYVEGYGICQACDIGGDIKGKTIDVYKNTQKQTRKWGVRKPKVYVIG